MDTATVIMAGNVGMEPVSIGSAPTRGTKFRMVSNHRRRDQDTGAWVDAAEYWVEVICWGRLATGVQDSVRRGDPVLVTGRLETTSWLKDGQKHTRDQLVASVVGHDLSKGTSSFRRSSRQSEVAPTEVRPSDVDEVDEPDLTDAEDRAEPAELAVG